MYGIVGIADKSVEELAKHCSGTLHTLDVNGCVNVKVPIPNFVSVNNEVPKRYNVTINLLRLGADAFRLACGTLLWSCLGVETCDHRIPTRFQTCAGWLMLLKFVFRISVHLAHFHSLLCSGGQRMSCCSYFQF